jgi:hypothetical protein
MNSFSNPTLEDDESRRLFLLDRKRRVDETRFAITTAVWRVLDRAAIGELPR